MIFLSDERCTVFQESIDKSDDNLKKIRIGELESSKTFLAGAAGEEPNIIRLNCEGTTYEKSFFFLKKNFILLLKF